MAANATSSTENIGKIVEIKGDRIREALDQAIRTPADIDAAVDRCATGRGHQRDRPEIGVRGVVDEGADTGPAEIGGKAQVGHQKQGGVDPPRAVPDGIEQGHTHKQRQALQPEHGSQAPGDGAGRLRVGRIGHCIPCA